MDFYIWDNGAWGLVPPSGVDCDDSSANDTACGTVFGDGLNNTNLSTEAPWAYTAKFPGLLNGVPQPNDFAEGTFFEGGVDLTAHGVTGCFETVLIDTSQSQKINESSQDFVLSSLEGCDSELVTTPADGSGEALTDTDDPPNGLPDVVIGLGSVGVDVTDQADLIVTGEDEWTGTIDFYLCGPIASGTCDSNGVLVDSQGVDQTTVFPITSASANLTSVGRYCWFGSFTSPTPGVPDASDATEGECFEVKPVQPTLSTTAWSTGDDTGSAQTDPVPFGDPLFDKATLSGTAFQPGTDGTNTTYPSINATMDTPANGSITFTLVGPDGAELDCTTVATGDGDNPETVAVSDDGDYFTSGFTPDSPGDFHWKASYTGDSPNTLGATHNDECDEVGEDVTVEQVPTEISTRQRVYPNDAARIASSEAGDNLPAGGTVTFRLYGPGDGNTALDNCLAHGETLGSGGLLYVEPVTVTGGANFETVSTNNTTVPVVASETYYWWVTYETGDSAHTGSQSDCVENVSLTFANDPGPGTLFPPAS